MILCNNTRRTTSSSLHFRNGTDRGNESSVLRHTEAPQTPSWNRALGLCDWVRRLSCLQNRAALACEVPKRSWSHVQSAARSRYWTALRGIWNWFYFRIYYHLFKSFVLLAGPALGTRKASTCLGLILVTSLSLSLALAKVCWLIMRFVIPVVFCERTSVECMYSSNTDTRSRAHFTPSLPHINSPCMFCITA